MTGATRIYLVRHCEAEGNLYRRTHGVFDSDITPKGERQLECLHQRMKPVHLDAVYASLLLRARKTAQAVARGRDLEVQGVPGLHERHMGAWEDMSWHEVRKRYPEDYARWLADLWGYPLPGGESERQAGLRFREAIGKVAARHPGQTICVVAHSMVIKSLQQLTLPESGGEIPFGDNTAVNLLVVEPDGTMHFEWMNDNAHLPPQLTTFNREAWTKGNKSLGRYSLEYVDWAELAGTGTALPTELAGLRLPPPPRDECFLGLDDGVPVGILAMQVLEDCGRVGMLYVVRTARRQGSGSQLLGEAMVRLRRRGVGRIILPDPDPAGEEWTAFAERNRLQREPVTAGGPAWSLPVGPMRLLPLGDRAQAGV